jgi:probable selenium-dependent hydroxylase accessory protein YqeC
VKQSLAAEFGIGERELVAFVGAGGKSTLLFRLGDELAERGATVMLTTTTKMGTDQARQVRCVAPGAVTAAFDAAGPVMVVATDDGHKITGPPPDEITALFATPGLDHVLVEADGARGQSFKTPADHEPVIPSATTLVVIVVGCDAIGRPIAEKCHRPELVAALAGKEANESLDIETMLCVMTHPAGVLRAVPDAARVMVALTKAHEARAGEVAELKGRIDGSGRFERCVVVRTA